MIEDILSRLGQLIKANRLKQVVALTDLSEQSGVSVSTFERIERGERSDLKMIMKVL